MPYEPKKISLITYLIFDIQERWRINQYWSCPLIQLKKMELVFWPGDLVGMGKNAVNLIELKGE